MRQAEPHRNGALVIGHLKDAGDVGGAQHRQSDGGSQREDAHAAAGQDEIVRLALGMRLSGGVGSLLLLHIGQRESTTEDNDQLVNYDADNNTSLHTG